MKCNEKKKNEKVSCKWEIKKLLQVGNKEKCKINRNALFSK